MESDGPDTEEAFYNPYGALHGPVMKGRQGSTFQSHISIASYTISPGTFAVFTKSKAFLGWVLQCTVEEIATQV